MNIKRAHNEIGLSQYGRADRTASQQLQKIYQLYFDTAKKQQKLKKYKKIKYQGIIYKIGDFVEIYHLGSSCPYVTKLVNIASIIHDEKSQEFEAVKIDLKCPMIEVEWYLRKMDLSTNPKFEEWDKIMSNNQVFASGQTFALPVEAIIGKCQVIAFDEYYVLGIIENSIYFSRAAYNIETETLVPKIEEWTPKYCFCSKPYNPDLQWVQCEKCKKWFHSDCIIMEDKDVKDFVCVKCENKDALNKKKKK